MSMKDLNMILFLVIPGRTTLENDIDVYFQPLIDDLHDLWNEGITTYDSLTKEIFQLHAVLLWTINNFLVYGNLFGYSMKGKLACSVWNKDIMPYRLKFIWV